MSKKNILVLILLFLFRVVVAFNLWHPDLNNHMDWGIRFFEYGPSKFYAPESNVWSFTWPNQPPGTMYMFAGIRKVFDFLFNLTWQINLKIPAFPSIIVSYFETNLYPALLKLPAILADFGIAYLIYKFTQKKWAAIVWLVNPIVWYNSTIWGQYDAVINFFALLSFYLLTKRKLSYSLLVICLSLYIKASLLIFVPIWLIIAIQQKYKFREYVFAVVCSLLALGLLTLPFSQGNPHIWLYNLYVNKVFVQQLHLITANAFNFWAAISGIHERPDSLPFLGLTYQIWGYILFTVSYIPLLKAVVRSQSAKSIAWVLALTAFSSFMLLTNMHERYLYPLFPYLTILLGLGFVSNWFYWTLSLLSLLNLYNFWFVPKIGFIVSFLSFGDRIMPRILGIVMFGLFLKLYLIHFRQEKNLKI